MIILLISEYFYKIDIHFFRQIKIYIVKCICNCANRNNTAFVRLRLTPSMLSLLNAFRPMLSCDMQQSGVTTNSTGICKNSNKGEEKFHPPSNHLRKATFLASLNASVSLLFTHSSSESSLTLKRLQREAASHSRCSLHLQHHQVSEAALSAPLSDQAIGTPSFLCRR